jgi:hypothetical protein
MPGLSKRQIQRNLDNIRYVRSLLKQEQRNEEKDTSHREPPSRSGRESLEETQRTDPDP